MERSVLSHSVKRIDFSYPRVDLRHLKSGVARFKEDHIVWWYNSIRVNTRGERTIPEVEVLFDVASGPRSSDESSCRRERLSSVELIDI